MALRTLNIEEYSSIVERENITHDFFQSPAYLKHLLSLLKDVSFVAFYHESQNSNSAASILPAIIKYGKKHSVLNSLPFYGSNGGIIGNKDEIAYDKLLPYCLEWCEQNAIAAAVIINSPYFSDAHHYEKLFGTAIDSRIGQITPLSENISDCMDIYHFKTRNMVRKAQKSGLNVRISNDAKSIDFLYHVHVDNIQSIGGIAKPYEFFSSIPSFYKPGIDYDLYLAESEGQTIAGLLLFYCGNVVEYYTPVIVKEFRHLQPLSLLIYEAMSAAKNNNYKFWNWGGTWKSQDGVYQFKSRWGTEDHPYYYYTKILNKDVVNCNKQELLSEYPFFYVYPFDKLASQS